MRYILRDHDWEKLTQRKETVLRIADYLNAKYGAGTVTVTLQDSYRNLEEVIRKHASGGSSLRGRHSLWRHPR